MSHGCSGGVLHVDVDVLVPLQTLLVVHLVGHLSSHAARHAMIKQVRNEVNDVGDLTQFRDEKGQNTANTCDRLEAVVDAYQTVVTRVGGKIIALHHIDTVGGDSKTVAKAAFQERTQIRTILFTTGACLKATATKVPLKARILRHIAEQHFLTQTALSNSHGWGQKLTAKPKARRRTIDTWGTHHSRLESISSGEMTKTTSRVFCRFT
mmetsp:Transcript_9959/g.16399  ORF Transcript_9959/g.16399 Transcript_9959/m.16399 type:complete len:209 (+) Transcript_9959:269-895(+)